MLTFKSKHFLTGEELSQKELLALLDSAELLKHSRPFERPEVLRGRSIALVFEKPSLRTRLSFTVGIQELGGQCLEITGSQKKNEDPEDTIRVLQGMVHGVMVRTFAHEILERMVSQATIPVINGLSDLHHPCQALADLLTLKQRFKNLQGLKLAYIGDGNNVLHSLLLLLPLAGVDVHYSCPLGHHPDPSILARAHQRAALTGAKIRSFSTPEEAVERVDALYTDVWMSMGFEKNNEAEAQAHLQKFLPYQLNLELYQRAKPSALVMHCLPMMKGQEITAEMAEHANSVLFQQTENRLHAQKALLIGLFNSLPSPRFATPTSNTQRVESLLEFE